MMGLGRQINNFLDSQNLRSDLLKDAGVTNVVLPVAVGTAGLIYYASGGSNNDMRAIAQLGIAIGYTTSLPGIGIYLLGRGKESLEQKAQGGSE